MRREAKILFVFDPDNASCKTFVEALRKALAGWDITIGAPGLMTRLFEVRKYNLVHSFHSPGDRASKFLKALPGNIRKVQTLLGPPEKPEDYRSLIVAHRAIVFSQAEREIAQKTVLATPVETIPPCAIVPDLNHLQPSTEVRDSFQVDDRMLVVSLSDVTSKEDFDSFVYITREYNRRGGFRFLVPRYDNDKETRLWRQRVQQMVEQEKLTSTTFLEEEIDLHSLIDSADVVLYLHKHHTPSFDFSLDVLEAAALGKPVLCFDRPPYNETLKEFVPAWICVNTEDVVRESHDLRKNAGKLEQIATDLARFARERFSPEKIAARYKAVYESVLKS